MEIFSGVVSFETIQTSFLMAAANNQQVCAANVSTAFLCSETREKIAIKARPEFGEDAGKIMLVEGSCHGLKIPTTQFHDVSAEKS